MVAVPAGDVEKGKKVNTKQYDKTLNY